MVRFGERREHLAQHVDDALEGERPLLVRHAREVLAAQELHDEVELAVSVLPKSMTATEFGWFSRLAARASVMKRAARSRRRARCGWMIFTATVRPSVFCSAR